MLSAGCSDRPPADSPGEPDASPDAGTDAETEGFDLSRIQDDVVYRDNDRNLDSAALAVPDPIDGL